MKAFDYEDIQLIPKMCVVESRKECDPRVKLGKHTFNLPVVPSNMATVVNEELCEKLAQQNYFYIMHRFNVDQVAFVKKMKQQGLIASISVGVKESDYQVIDNLKKENLTPDYITIDIAHAHALSVKKIIEHIRKNFKQAVFIIAGNVGTPKGVRDLEYWGADATKVGIGPGKVCITKLKTGFGNGGWQLAAVKWCSKGSSKPIIADGGLRVNGDIAKSIRMGATMCMIGSLFAAHQESPGKLVVENGVEYKEYFGSASEYNKEEKRYVEGKKELITVRGSIFDTLKEMTEDLQSSISYAGGCDLEAIKKVDYVILKDSNF
ncbi:guanosine 5'-monophosphate oxidoreductase [Spiroplasma mirum ATCC 29335]|uniref:GMP reductase n=1 Tax=Spiroplasma mirum ATCC 29335 TaxID=838561 RepID=W0GLQ9_9MOLU|nr:MULTISPECIES: GMP reductase [Spiroplasma]AHF61175.1 guanosine 5'-monophosphate oxidoreductase [Spiroplasma mirum ATCC 29335]AHI58243.1 guanosine 5'-monophosphate oxidoreductase [Spiroplasma mirum ATCC 29335]AKM53271.1 guanosine 5'-monophosphate oxidoreductase [Spiroplasma atrichopogonis]